MSVEDTLAKLDEVTVGGGPTRWEPHPEVAVKILELAARGVKAGRIAKALQGTEDMASEKTVRSWLERQTLSTP